MEKIPNIDPGFKDFPDKSETLFVDPNKSLYIGYP